MKIFIIGAGLAGATATVWLRQHGYNDIEVFEARSHIGGNCYDSKINDIMVHHYGPHAFHTNHYNVWNFVNQFDSFNNFKLTVKARTSNNQIINVPFNNNNISIVGDWSEEIIKKEIFVTYSEKHWGMPFDQLPYSITKRVPVKRNNNIDFYHLDLYQGLPTNGYTYLLRNMFEDTKIHLNCKNNDWKKYDADLIIYSGSIDEYYDYTYGTLTYRSLLFEYNRTYSTPYVQLNECNNQSNLLRTIDHSHWYSQKPYATIITKEFPCEFDINNPLTMRFYPKTFQSNDLYNKYKNIPNTKTIFVGRLGTYKYLDMDDCIKQTLTLLAKKYEITSNR